MLAEDRFYSAFQPIVAAANLFEPFAYECLLRGVAEDGSTVYPDAIFSTARAAGLLFQVDRAARLSAIRCASEQGLETPLFINFNPTAIYDPKFCLKATTDAIREADFAPEQIVFEIVESDDVGSLEHLLDIVSYYRERGFRVALDDLGSGYSSLTLLAKLKPDFVKFDRGLVAGIDGDVYKQKLFIKLLELARELGVTALAEGVETEGETGWLLERRVDLLQGYFFARPAPSPPLPQPHFRAPRPRGAEGPRERTLA